MPRPALLACLLTTTLVAAEGTGGLSLTEVDDLFAKVADATTSAQQYVWQKKAMEQIQGTPISAEMVVSDVKAVTLEGDATFAIEGQREAGPVAYGLVFYCADEDAALAVDRGDRVRLTGTGHGIFFRKEQRLAVKDARIDQVPATATVSPSAATDAGQAGAVKP